MPQPETEEKNYLKKKPFLCALCEQTWCTYRWVCTSGRPEDLATTDRLAREVLEQQVWQRYKLILC